ncbi:hypothetical protein FLLO111716_08280 [Flavobacterium longum]|uniref:hypothetical protein n=1 Tax=Flavobacterium longum TaxID=1299340 RepID=UPI0039EA9A02
MKQLNLPFKIDKQYENWQFELDALDDRLPGYHSYLYIGEQLNYFLNYPTDSAELIFNGDYLTAVILIMKISTGNELNDLFHFLVHYKATEIRTDEDFRLYKFGQVQYCMTTIPKKGEFIIVYGTSKFMQKHLSIILFAIKKAYN